MSEGESARPFVAASQTAEQRCATVSRMTVACWMLLVILLASTDAFYTNNLAPRDSWQRPGCHKVGHTRKISIPDCIEFHMTTNACRGFCDSWAIPSGPKGNPDQPVTSVGQCCNIMESEPVEAQVLCLDGIRKLTFKSAVSCSCYHCKKE